MFSILLLTSSLSSLLLNYYLIYYSCVLQKNYGFVLLPCQQRFFILSLLFHTLFHVSYC